MYQLNADSEFIKRTESLFDTLSGIETSYKAKNIPESISNNIEHNGVEGEEPIPITKVTNEFDEVKIKNEEPIFKMPQEPIKSSNKIKNKVNIKNEKDDKRDPEKWEMYTLSDVKEINQGSNYAAAMSFLNTRNRIDEGEDENMTNNEQKVEFNRPLNKKYLIEEEIFEEEEEVETDQSDPIMKNDNIEDKGFTKKKRVNKMNLRKKSEDETKQEDLNEPDMELD